MSWLRSSTHSFRSSVASLLLLLKKQKNASVWSKVIGTVVVACLWTYYCYQILTWGILKLGRERIEQFYKNILFVATALLLGGWTVIFVTKSLLWNSTNCSSDGSEAAAAASSAYAQRRRKSNGFPRLDIGASSSSSNATIRGVNPTNSYRWSFPRARTIFKWAQRAMYVCLRLLLSPKELCSLVAKVSVLGIWCVLTYVVMMSYLLVLETQQHGDGSIVGNSSNKLYLYWYWSGNALLLVMCAYLVSLCVCPPRWWWWWYHTYYLRFGESHPVGDSERIL
jgi:hypothetical protein